MPLPPVSASPVSSVPAVHPSPVAENAGVPAPGAPEPPPAQPQEPPKAEARPLAGRLDNILIRTAAMATRSADAAAGEDFSRLDVQKRLLARDLAVPENPIRPIGKYRLDDKETVSEARYQTRSIFARDLLPVLDRGLWRA